MAQLDITGLAKRYGDFYAVRDVSLGIRDGEFLVLLGPSGCGKTTTLRMVAGFIEPTAGHVKLGGSDVTLLPPWKRNAGMVFQSYALFPHLSVAQNVAFGLEMRKLARADIERRVEETLALVWHWPAHSPSGPTCCCSTSRFPTSTPSCARKCVSRSASCSASSASQR